MNETSNVIALPVAGQPGVTGIPGDLDDGPRRGIRGLALAFLRAWRLPGWWPATRAEVELLNAGQARLIIAMTASRHGPEVPA